MNDTLPEAFATNYTPGTMSFSDGWLGADILAARAGVEINPDVVMIYDHDLALAILRREVAVDGGVTEAVVGLDGDWSENSANLLFHDWITDESVEVEEPDIYSGSLWAAPTMLVEYADGTNKAFRVFKEIPSDEF